MGTVHSSTVVTVSGGFHSQYKPQIHIRTMAYSWDNRVKFVVRYMYDIDGNGALDKNDFECLAVRNTVIEGKGEWNEATFKKNQEVMANLWNEIAELADFNKDNEVSGDEFAKAIQSNCVGKAYVDFPPAFKSFVTSVFKSIDIDGDGSVGLTEFRVDCVNRMAYKTIGELDAAYEKLLNDDDKRPVVLLWNVTKNCTLNSLAILMRRAMPVSSLAPLKSSLKK